MRMHARSGMVPERLGHERGIEPLFKCDLLDDKPKCHQVVRSRQRIGVPKIDFLLARSALVMGKLNGDAHGLQDGDCLTTKVVGDTVGCIVEVAVVIDRNGLLSDLRLVLEQVELNLRVRVESKSEVCSLRQRALQHITGIGVGRSSIRHQDVAEHPCDTGAFTAPGQEGEGCRIGLGEHVRFVDPGEAFDS